MEPRDVASGRTKAGKKTNRKKKAKDIEGILEELVRIT
jgi:hypothetical protein